VRREGWLRRFFLMRDELAAAERAAFGGSAARREAFGQATAARDAAEVLMAHAPKAAEQACQLLKEGLLAATRAALPEPAASPAEAWAALSSQPGGGGLDALTTSEREALARAFVGTKVDSAAADSAAPDSAAADSAETRVTVLRCGLDAVLAASSAELRAAAQLRMTRRLRWAVAVLLPLAIAAGGVWLQQLSWRRSNLALHRPTTSSSRLAQHPETTGAVDGKLYGIGFHTNNEDRPWLQIDLQRVHPVHQVITYNSDHCCFERAVPLVIQVSTDAKAYREVARREKPFGVWRADFAPVQARYVKLTVDRTSMLHLAEVEVR
jgi:hypothetical protein